MRKWLWSAFGVTIAIALSPIAYHLWFFATNGIFGPCGEEVLAKKSPSRRAVSAKLFIRNCGATTPFSTHVEIAFEGTDAEPISVFRGQRMAPVDVNWLSDTHLLITYQQADEVNITWKAKQADEVEITYNKVPAD